MRLGIIVVMMITAHSFYYSGLLSDGQLEQLIGWSWDFPASHESALSSESRSSEAEISIYNLILHMNNFASLSWFSSAHAKEAVLKPLLSSFINDFFFFFTTLFSSCSYLFYTFFFFFSNVFLCIYPMKWKVLFLVTLLRHQGKP